MRRAIVILLLPTTPALSLEAENSPPRTEINGGFRTNTINGVRVWRPFPPAPSPVVVAPPPPANIYVTQTAQQVEPTYGVPFYGPRNHVRQHFQPPRQRPAQHQFRTPGLVGRPEWRGER